MCYVFLCYCVHRRRSGTSQRTEDEARRAVATELPPSSAPWARQLLGLHIHVAVRLGAQHGLDALLGGGSVHGESSSRRARRRCTPELPLPLECFFWNPQMVHDAAADGPAPATLLGGSLEVSPPTHKRYATCKDSAHPITQYWSTISPDATRSFIELYFNILTSGFAGRDRHSKSTRNDTR